MNRKKYTAPFYVDISITNSCNLKCVYCYAEANENKHTNMEVQLFSKIIKELEANGVHYVRIAGGEPLIHPQIQDILDVCGEVQMLKSMSANATLLSSRLASKIVEAKIDWVVVSLDGADATTHDVTRGKFLDTVRGINLLQEAGIRMKIACVVNSNNYKHIEKLVEFAKQNGIYSVGFILQSDVGRAHNCVNNFHMISIQMKEFIEKVTLLKEKSKSVKVNVVFPYESSMPWEIKAYLNDQVIDKIWREYVPYSQDREISCMAGITTCAISAEGELFGCEQMLGFPELSAGSLKDNSFKKLWDEFTCLKVLRDAQPEMLPLECQRCDIGFCGGGCRAIAYANTKNLLGADGRCTIVGRENV